MAPFQSMVEKYKRINKHKIHNLRLWNKNPLTAVRSLAESSLILSVIEIDYELFFNLLINL